MVLGKTSATFDPAWPWSLPGAGLSAFVGVVILLTALTVWTYLGVRGASWRRVTLVLALRLAALVIAFIVVLRPSLAFEDTDDVLPSRLFFLVDSSESMTVTDEFDNLSRWANARRILASPVVKEALKRLTAGRVELVYYQGADELRKYDPDSQANGKSTDMGSWLHEFHERHGRERNLRGLVILSDGADNGTKYSTLEQAALLHGCPIYAFGLGRPTTTSKQNDIEFTDIRVEPDPIPVKGKMTVKGLVNAPGFENSSVAVSLWLQEGAKPARKVTAVNEILRKTQRNEVVVTCDAPDVPGEIKVTLKIQPIKGEISELNNEISTYATVSKEGVSILWVEGRWPRLDFRDAVRFALRSDPRFRVAETLRLLEEKAAVGGEETNLLAKHYDVIVVGDISAKRFAGGDLDIFRKIKAAVSEDGTGLLMVGGQETFLNSDWHQPFAKDLADLLPVTLDKPGQIERKVRMQPTPAGLSYLLRLDENPEKNRQLWNKFFDPLDGVSNIGTPKPTATVFAQAEVDLAPPLPLLVGTTVGKGRVLAFAGDTTWMAWRRNKEAIAGHARFWKQLMLYLARQENTDSAVQITLDKRRVAADGSQPLGFTLKVRGKDGLDVKNPIFSVKVRSPAKEETEVPVTLEGGEYRGYFLKANAAGDYLLSASAKGKDTSGTELATRASEAHFLGYAQDREMLRPAADHDFLAKVASASGGRFALADERKVAGVLEELVGQRDSVPRARVELWPDWRRNPASDSLGDQVAALWNSSALPSFIAFAALLCTEWYLRRRWGLV